MKRVTLFVLTYFIAGVTIAQYAPQATVAGSTAISATSSQLVGWATGCTIYRGYLDIANPSLGYTTSGDSASAIGAVDHNVVSLGDSGIAVLTFASPLYNGPGADFAVFENGFADPTDPNEAFLELAFVEVSSDGVHYYRFPVNSLTQDTVQIREAGDYMDARKLNNLAGKYVANYGTPFDLEELAGKTDLDINNITHVRVVDVIGSIGNHASYDSAGRKINDPYPTPHATGGFDLDAVGAIHEKGLSVPVALRDAGISVYPNPASDQVTIAARDLSGGMSVTLMDVTGNVLYAQQLSQNINHISVTNYRSGMYYLVMQDANGNKWVEKITKL